MAALPPLHNLHLNSGRGARTGVTLELRAASDEADSSGKGVGGFSTTKDVSDKLGGLLQDLEDNAEFVHKWRVAVATNLKNKYENYAGQVQNMYREIIREQELQRRLINAARRPLEVLRDLPVESAKVPRWLGADGGWSNTSGEAPVDKEQRRENTALVDMAASKTQILGEDGMKRWRTLNLQVEAIAKLQNEIVDRSRAIFSEAGWRDAVARFVNQVRKLKDYPEALSMIEKLVDLVRAFVGNPTIAGSQFFNVMIMGVAGTGKTRLAGILGNILAQLGLYVYDELVESSVGDFIAGFEGQTEDKVVSFLTNNAEKVIFLDEAYALTKWDREHTHLEGYSPEAVAELIAFLSKNVGKIAFIAAGYEDKMVRDFLAANEGFERRFPIRVTLGSYTNATLYRIFIRGLALTFFPPEPKDREAHKKWEQDVAAQEDRCYTWFRDEAVLVLYAVIDASKAKREEEEGQGEEDDWDPYARFQYPHLAKMFTAQAGAMTNLAGVASALLISNKNGGQLGASVNVDRRAMFDILLTMIDTTFTGTTDGDPDRETARQELIGALQEHTYINAQGKEQTDRWISKNGKTWLVKPNAVLVPFPRPEAPFTADQVKYTAREDALPTFNIVELRDLDAAALAAATGDDGEDSPPEVVAMRTGGGRGGGSGRGSGGRGSGGRGSGGGGGSGGAPPSQSGSGSTAAPSVALPDPQDIYEFDLEGKHFAIPIWDAAQQDLTEVEAQWVQSELDRKFPDRAKQQSATLVAQAQQWYRTVKGSYRAANHQGGTKSKRPRFSPPPWA